MRANARAFESPGAKLGLLGDMGQYGFPADYVIQRPVAHGFALWKAIRWFEYGPDYEIIQTMSKISVQDLKARLSSAIAEAEAGETLVITRHHTPVATLGPAASSAVRRGTRVGRGALVPILPAGTRGRALAALLEDRGDR